MITTILISLAITLSSVVAKADLKDIFFDRPFFHHTDTLAPRDEWDLLHQSRTTLYETDFAPRHSWRPLYYLESGRELIARSEERRVGKECGSGWVAECVNMKVV